MDRWRHRQRLVDIDDDALSRARARLGTKTIIKDTVNEALRLAAAERARDVHDALDALAEAELADRTAAWT